VQHIIEDLVIVLASEGRSPAQHDEHDYSHRPVVALGCIASLQDFWGDIVGSSVWSCH
jgi:hypothetical protein